MNWLQKLKELEASTSDYDDAYNLKEHFVKLLAALEIATEQLNKIKAMGCNSFGGDEPCWSCEAHKALSEIEKMGEEK